MRGLLRPAQFDDEELADRARMFHHVAWLTMTVATSLVCIVAILQPAFSARVAFVVGVIDGAGLALLWLAARGHVRLASALFTATVMFLIGAMATRAGGIQSPGVGMLFVCVVMAGVLLGMRGAVIAAMGCTLIATTLVILETAQLLPPVTTSYSAWSRLFLLCMYLGVTLALLQLSTKAMAGALQRTRAQVERTAAEMKRAEGEMKRAEAERTRRASVEEQLRHAQKLESLGTLAGGIAHDFNNILTAVGFNLEMALEDVPEGHVAREALTDIAAAQLRARDLVKRILLFSRKQDAERKVTQLGGVVREAFQLLRASLPPMIEMSLEESAIPLVSIDASQMHQVFMNLGTNAAHAMKESGGKLLFHVSPVTVSAPTATLTAQTYVRVAVTDTGAGMSEAVRARVFEPFFTTKGAGGTGLGLSVVHGIVTDHGGAIELDSAPGRGTTFRVFIPAAIDDGDALVARPNTSPRGSGERVLYVDDEAAVRTITARVLERLGYAVTAVDDPTSALATFRKDPRAFDVVVTDGAMPGMTGIELAHGVHAARPDMKVVLFSGYLDAPDDAQRAAGFSAHVAKPPGEGELARELRRVLDASPVPVPVPVPIHSSS